MQMDAYRLELVLPEWLRWTGWCKALIIRRSPSQGFTVGNDQPPLAGLCQVGGRSQDFVLRTASWAKFSRPSGAIAKQLQDGRRKHNRSYLRRTPQGRY